MGSGLGRIWGVVRLRGGPVAVEILVNAVLPLVIFDLAQPSLGDVRALIASSVPPILWSLIEFAWHRDVDAVSILVLIGIAFSLLAFVGTGGAKFLQLRETLVGGLIGLVFLGSVLIRRPLIYHLARATLLKSNPGEAQTLLDLKGNVRFERTMTTMTLAWGFGMVASTTVNCALVFVVSIPTYLAVSPVIYYSVVAVLALWSLLRLRDLQRRGGDRQMPAEPADAQLAPGIEAT